LGCSAEAEVQIIPLSTEDQFLILASDGVWEFLTNEKVTKILDHSLVEIQNAQPIVVEKSSSSSANGNNKKKKKPKAKRDVMAIRQSEAEVDWSRLLSRSARDRWIKENQVSIGVVDDISCVVVRLQVQNPGKIDLPDGTEFQGGIVRKSMAIPPPPTSPRPPSTKQTSSSTATAASSSAAKTAVTSSAGSSNGHTKKRDSAQSFPSMPPISSQHESAHEPNF
jgi:hypothetical protein